MRERKPIEEIMFAIFEVVLTIVMTVNFLVVLVTHGKVVALINLLLVFGILLNILTGVYTFFKGIKVISLINMVMAAACLVIIFL